MIVAPALPGLSAEFGDTPNAEFLARLTLTMPALFVALSAPIFGLLLDRIGRRPILAVSVVVYLVSGTSGFFADSFIAILVGRAFLGLAAAGLMTGAVTVIADLYSGTSLNRFMGYQTAAVGLGGMLFLLVSGFLADIGWRLPFLLHLVALPVLPGVLLTIEEPRKVAVAGVQKAAAALAPFPWRSVAVIYATAPPMMFVLSIFPIQLPFYMTSRGRREQQPGGHGAGAANAHVDRGGALLHADQGSAVVSGDLRRYLRHRGYEPFHTGTQPGPSGWHWPAWQSAGWRGECFRRT